MLNIYRFKNTIENYPFDTFNLNDDDNYCQKFMVHGK